MVDYQTVSKSKVNENKSEFWNSERIRSVGADINVILSGRSDGKTFDLLCEMLKGYVKDGSQGAYIRRYDEDLKGKSGYQTFENLINNGKIEEITNGKWTTVYYYSGRWYLARYKNVKGKEVMEKDNEPFAFGLALTKAEHYKSLGFPKVRMILFDEMISTSYLRDEFIIYNNLISTIVRNRDDVKIYLIGNLINPYNPYTEEMGLWHVKYMEPDDIDLYTYGNEHITLKIAVEKSMGSEGRTGKIKPSAKYFCFDNPALKMMFSSEWQIPQFPHLPAQYRPKDILYTYFIEFDRELFQCEIIKVDDSIFTYVHRKTTPLKDEKYDLIYSQEFDPRPNHRRGLKNPRTPLEKKILEHFKQDLVFYQDNVVGNAINNFIEWSKGC